MISLINATSPLEQIRSFLSPILQINSLTSRIFGVFNMLYQPFQFILSLSFITAGLTLYFDV